MPFTSDLLVRQGHAADLKAVFSLNRKAFDEAWSLGSLHAALENGFDLFVCEHAGILAGYILSQDILDEVHVMQVAVDVEYRRLGVASMLSRHLFTCKAAMAAVLLEVRASNKPARRLYAGLGFREDGLRRQYYTADANGIREDAVLMSMRLRKEVHSC